MHKKEFISCIISAFINMVNGFAVDVYSMGFYSLIIGIAAGVYLKILYHGYPFWITWHKYIKVSFYPIVFLTVGLLIWQVSVPFKYLGTSSKFIILGMMGLILILLGAGWLCLLYIYPENVVANKAQQPIPNPDAKISPAEPVNQPPPVVTTTPVVTPIEQQEKPVEIPIEVPKKSSIKSHSPKPSIPEVIKTVTKKEPKKIEIKETNHKIYWPF